MVKTVIKRDGSKVKFNGQKIIDAISKSGFIKDDFKQKIAKEVENINKNEISVEEIQDIVEKKMMASSYKDEAKEYVRYRYKREMIRNSEDVNNSVLEIISLKNKQISEENSNKNPVVLSTQRDYMAGEVSKDISRRLLLDDEIVKAHDEGIIHFHDMDYFGQKMFNCFNGGTSFITDKGIKQFKDFHDGDTVYVKDMYGETRKGTVHTYGYQKMNKVTFKNVNGKYEVICTPNHRWVLHDGTVTTNLKVGDVLYKYEYEFTVDSIEHYHDSKMAWCIEEPVTHTFLLDKGIVTGNCCLINLEDMLNNGTCINGTMVEKPHSFSTACNIATQACAQVASNQYGYK